jgi:Flp pilus assembly protein TadD
MTLAREDLERNLLSDPFNTEMRTQYAQLLQSLGDYPAALAQFELLVKQAPGDGAAHVGCAMALLRMGREGEALQH